MEATLNSQESKDKKVGKTASFIIHLILLMLIFYPFMQYEDPPPGQAGILVSFGEPDAGEGSNQPDKAMAEAAPPEETVEEEVEEVPEETEPEEVEPEVKPEPEKPKPVEKEAKPVKEVNDDKNSKELALKKKKEKERKEKAEKERKEKAEKDRKKKAADAKKKAEADAKRKVAEAKAKAAAAAKAAADAAQKKKEADAKALKDQIGGLFGNNGNGNGDNGKPGSQGDPNGGDSDILDGISTGTGKIGGGLGNRGGQGPPIKDNSQETGIVVIKVCVNNKGKVVSAKYTQKGSTSSSSRLIKLAQANAKKYVFKKGSMEKQCGTITYDFKVK